MSVANENKKEWFYLDSAGIEQGPFSLADMRTWWRGGYFPVNLEVRLNREYKFHLLRGREDYILFKDPNDTSVPEIKPEPPTESTPAPDTIVPTPSSPPPSTTPVVEYRDYAIKGSFNNRTGRWESRFSGQPEDRALRQMSYYFDLDLYQRIKSGEIKPEKKRKPTEKKKAQKKKAKEEKGEKGEEEGGEEGDDTISVPKKKGVRTGKKQRLVIMYQSPTPHHHHI